MGLSHDALTGCPFPSGRLCGTPPPIPAMQLVGLRSCLAFLTLSTVGAPSGTPALLREAQWVIGHGIL